MDFLILRPLPPKTGYHFFEGGVGVGGGGGSKVFAEQATSSGDARYCQHGQRSNGNAADPGFAGVGSNPDLMTFSAAAGGGAKLTRTGFEPATTRMPGGCITTRQLLGMWR